MERLKNMKEALMNAVESQLYGNLEEVNAQELGEAVDMIKDLSEAIYYCSISEEMEECHGEDEIMEHIHRYMGMPHYKHQMALGYNREPEIIEPSSRMYYDGRAGNRMIPGGRMYYGMEGQYSPHIYNKESYPSEIRDFREGRSPMTRRNYMESKELHQGKEKQMKELEKYMKELGEDISEMIQGAEPEEKMILSQKLSTLAEKVR